MVEKLSRLDELVMGRGSSTGFTRSGFGRAGKVSFSSTSLAGGDGGTTKDTLLTLWPPALAAGSGVSSRDSSSSMAIIFSMSASRMPLCASIMSDWSIAPGYQRKETQPAE